MATSKRAKLYKVSPTKIGKRPIYKFFIDCNGNYFPLCYLLDLGSTALVISPEAVNAFQVTVVTNTVPARASDVGGTSIITEGTFTIPVGLSFGNHMT